MRTGRSQWFVVPLAAALALTVAGSGAHASVDAPGPVTFQYTGAAQTWVVPAGVTFATFDVIGAQGGSGNVELRDPLPGGFGGRATAAFAVTPGSTVAVFVGGQGENFDPSAPDCTNRGGFNGGADAGTQVSGTFCGQGGGGASDVRIGGVELSDRVLVAGGGGGAAANLFCPGAGGGGGLTGQSGTNAGLCTGGGSGGNQTGSSGSGRLGVGSVGGNESGALAPGGGGGGGYYGGAGGGTNGYGGGGGSGFGPEGTVFATNVRDGNGYVTITPAQDPLAETGAGDLSSTVLVAITLFAIGGLMVLLPKQRRTAR